MSEVSEQGVAVDIDTAIGHFLTQFNSAARRSGRLFDADLGNTRSRFLEVGCGIGNHMNVLRNNGIDHVYGFDIMARCVEVAKRKLGLNKVLVANAKRIPFRSRAFDHCLCYNVIEHVEAPEAVLREVARVLNEGGLLYIDCPNAKSPGDRLFRYGSLLLYGKTSHIQKFTWKSFARLLERTGFDIIETRVHKGIFLDYPQLNRIPLFNPVKRFVSFLCKNTIDSWELKCVKSSRDISPNVCVLSSLYHTTLGGLGRQAVLLTETLARSGIPLFVITRKMADTPPCPYALGVDIDRVRTPWPALHILEEKSLRNLVISLCFSAGALYTLWKRRAEYQIVHVHGASLPLMICILPLKFLKKKVVAKVAAANLGTEAGSFDGRYGLLGRLFIQLIRKVDRFVAISEEIEQGLRKDTIALSKITRIPNMVDAQRFKPASQVEKKELKRGKGHDDCVWVVFSGRLVSRKGFHVLLQAWKGIAARFPKALLLVLGEGPERADYQKSVYMSGLEDGVLFKGRVPDVDAWLRAADFLVFPSLQEGFPNGLLEAMACGLPVVASRIGGVTDVVEDGLNGLLVPPDDAAALEKGLACLLSRPGEAAVLGKNAAEAIRGNYAVDTIVTRYRKLYQEILS